MLDKRPYSVYFKGYLNLNLCIEYGGGNKCERANSFYTIQSNGKKKQYMFIT